MSALQTTLSLALTASCARNKTLSHLPQDADKNTMFLVFYCRI